MKNKLLTIVMCLICGVVFGQNRMYNLTTQFDSVKVKKLIITGVLNGASGVFSSSLNSSSFIKDGGTSDQILLANGGTSLLSSLISSGNASSAVTLSLDVAKEVQIFSGTISTWTLPVITGSSWKKLYIKNRGSGILVVNANGGTNTIYTTTAVSTFSLNPGESVILVNDSTYWSLF